MEGMVVVDISASVVPWCKRLHKDSYLIGTNRLPDSTEAKHLLIGYCRTKLASPSIHGGNGPQSLAASIARTWRAFIWILAFASTRSLALLVTASISCVQVLHLSMKCLLSTAHSDSLMVDRFSISLMAGRMYSADTVM